MRLATVLQPAPDVRAALERALELERMGIDRIGVSEAYGLDAVSLLGYLAARTEHVELIAQILPVYSRTPTLVAMTAAGLDAVSDGRFVLGLGASGPQVVEGWHGVRYDAPLGRTREVIEICRKVWARDTVVHAGRHYSIPLGDGGTGLGKSLKLIAHPTRARIPIYLAALGQRNVQMAASVADGWIPFVFVPERADQVWGEALRRGLRERPDTLATLQVSAGGPFALTNDPGQLRDRGRARLALYVGGMGSATVNFYNQVARRYGFEREATEVQERYLRGDKRGAEAALPAALVEGTSLIGDEAYLRDRLQAHAAAGVTVLQVDPIGPTPAQDLARLRELVEGL